MRSLAIKIFSLLILLMVIVVSWKKDHQRKKTITENNFSFRDLNKNGKLDVYEDSRQPIEARINDLLKQMTIEEKAGMMFINGARINDDGSIDDKPGKGMFAFAPNAL